MSGVTEAKEESGEVVTTYEQNLIEEIHALSEMLNQIAPAQLEVKKIREVFRYILNRKTKAEKLLKGYNYDPSKKQK